MARFALPAILPPLFLLACGVGQISPQPGGGNGNDVPAVDGGTDNGGDGGSETQSYALTATPASAEIELGQEVTFGLVLTSENFEGPVNLSLTGGLDDWNVQFTPATTVNLTRNGTAQASVTVAVPSNSIGGLATLQIEASGALGARTTSAAVTVDNVVTLTIPAGSGAGNHGLPTSVAVRSGTPVRVVNADNTSHQIHAPGDQHGGPMGTGQSHTLNFGPGAAEIYCHDHGTGTGVTTIGVSAN